MVSKVDVPKRILDDATSKKHGSPIKPAEDMRLYLNGVRRDLVEIKLTVFFDLNKVAPDAKAVYGVVHHKKLLPYGHRHDRRSHRAHLQHRQRLRKIFIDLCQI